MIVSVTTLGSRSGNAAGAAAAVVKYLEGSSRADRAGRDPGPSPELPGVDPDGVVGYYADSMAAPGIWMGQGLTGVALSGLADSEQLQRVLLGQNPYTGEQLLAATGSAQRAHPNAVRAALRGPDDELLGIGEAAEALGVEASYLRRQVLATHKVRARHAQQTAAREELAPLPPSYLDATRDGPRAPWKVARGELRRFANERDKPSVVVGYDLTFSVAKSVSVLWATATPSQQVAIEAAFTDAVRSGVRYLEEQAAHVRVSVGNDSGKGTHLERQAATGLVAAAYLHDTSRALDPQLHFHVVVANMAEGPDGKIRALDGRSLYLHAKTASHLAAAELRHRLSCDLGLTWQPVRRGLADVEGVSR
ncbi:MAG TPA: MobF family relaxase, partial [Acidimicrobiales bacterium]